MFRDFERYADQRYEALADSVRLAFVGCFNGSDDAMATSLLLDVRAELMIKKWHAKIRSLDIHNRGMLEQSFSEELVWEPRGASEIEYLKAIVFKFFDYGRFVDYGLGRGTNLVRRFKRGSKAEDNPRKRKEWIREPCMEHRIELVPWVQFRTRREIVNY